MKIALLVIGSLAGLLALAVLVLYLLGRRLPERHTATLTVNLPAPPAAVWAVITDYVHQPDWWPDVKAVRLETRPNGETLAWNTDGHGHEIAFRTKEEVAPTRLVREIVGDDLPFGGTWTFALAEQDGGTRLTLTEDGFVRPPLFRAVMQYFVGPDKTMKSFAASLTKRVAR